MSSDEAAAVIVGAVPPAHLTEDGQVAVRLPVPSCLIKRTKLVGPGGAVNV